MQVLESPMEDAVALPLEDNLLVWHGNGKSLPGSYDDLTSNIMLVPLPG